MSISRIQRERVARAVRNYPIAKIQLFGSRANGTARRTSDYDLLIHFRPDYTPSLFDLGGLHYTLTKALRADVDVVPFRTSLPSAILNDAETIFERA